MADQMVTIDPWALPILMLVMAFIVLAAVALGGFLVYRTKREAHEAFLVGRQPLGTAYAADPLDASGQDPLGRPLSAVDEIQDPVGEIIRDQNNRFLRQVLSDRAREGAG